MFGKKTNLSLIWQGFLQAFGVTFYYSLIGLFFWKGNELFGKFDRYLAPVLFLVLFSVSALICGLIVFYQPYKLFFDGKKKRAVNLIIATTTWLFFFLVVFLLLAVFL